VIGTQVPLHVAIEKPDNRAPSAPHARVQIKGRGSAEISEGDERKLP
jgi:hypothetical protein